ncbi:hypothetical protein VN12_15840 [Pirellula sp. SH-Sr6A]|nr:hypothetical protein VN12_15840 [Pirellula sp. SH-Sr6A]
MDAIPSGSSQATRKINAGSLRACEAQSTKMKLPNLLRLLQSKNKSGQVPLESECRNRDIKDSNEASGALQRNPLKQLQMHLRGATARHENQSDESAVLLATPFSRFCPRGPVINRCEYVLSC